MKRLIILLFCILTALELAGCKSGKENDIQNDDTQMMDNDDNEKADANEDAMGGEYVSNDSNKGEIILTDALYENYMEKRNFIEKANGEEFLANIFINAENRIEYYTKSDVGGDTIVWKYTLKDDETWKREEVKWLNELKDKIDQRRITVVLGEDGNYYAYYIEKGERPHLVKKDGEGFIEILIPDWDKTEDRDFYMVIDQLAVLKNGNIVMASRNKTCYIYDKDSGIIIDTFPCGHYLSMITKDNYIIILDNENLSALVYDAEQGKIVNEIYGNFNAETLFFIDEDILYACCKWGILKTGLLEDSWELLLEPGDFRFASQAPCRFFVKDLDFYILNFIDFNALMIYTERTKEDVVEDELVIFSLRDNAAIREMIVEFQLRYPEIKIIYEVGRIGIGGITLSDSIRALNTRIMNGKGPDIFLLEGLPVDSYIEKGILADLKDEMKDYMGELHQGILNVYQTDNGEIYMYPTAIGFPIIYTVPESEKAISSLHDLVELSESREDPLTYGMLLVDAVDVLYHYYPPEIIFEKDEVLEDNLKVFLEQVKRFCVSEGILENRGEYNYSQRRGGYMELIIGKIPLAFQTMMGIGNLGNTPALLERIEGKINTNQDSFIPIGLLGINQASQNQSEAFLFLKEILSYSMQAKFNGPGSIIGFPVNRAVIEEMRKIDQSFSMVGFPNLGIVANEHNAEDSSKLVDMINSLDKSWSMDETVYEILLREAVLYIRGNAGMDETVQKIKNNLELYLFE